MMEDNTTPEPLASPKGADSFMARLNNFWDRAPGWVRRATPPAVALSLVAHALFIIIGAFVMVRGGQGSTTGTGEEGGGNGGPVEVAMMSGGELSEIEAMASSESTLPAIPDMPVDAGLAPLEAIETSPIGDLSGDELGAAADTAGMGALGGGGDVTGIGGIGLGGSGAGGGGASFFGVAASGTRFAYIVDNSGSMEGKRLVMLQEQLNKTVSGLSQNAQFIIVAFSDEAQPLGNKKEWRDASDSGRKWARTEIDLMRSAGGTRPKSAIEIIFRMRPLPDAIYFMTDGEFGDEVVDEVSKANRRVKIPIHCICLGSESGQENMKLIAKQSGGTFKFIAE